MTKVILLGPQRYQPSIAQACAGLNLEGPLAVITAGWQEREAELEELDAHLGQETINLNLHQRGEEVFRQDPGYKEAHRRHQASLRRLQELYRIRLNNAQDAVQLLMARNHMPHEIIGPEIEDSIQSVRSLDEHHLRRIRSTNRKFEEEWTPHDRPSIAGHRMEISEIVEKCSGVLIAGGHVAVLLNRLRMFKLEPMLAQKPIIAWSAGAMVLAKRIVLFHDNPPQGKGFAEVFEAGLGLYSNLIPLPHASKRLQLNNPTRVSIFARRFSHSVCVPLDPDDRIDWDGNWWHTQAGTRKLSVGGELEPWEEA